MSEESTVNPRLTAEGVVVGETLYPLPPRIIAMLDPLDVATWDIADGDKNV